MKTTPAADVRVQHGVCTVTEDNGCKHLRNGNEISAVSLPENTCILVRRLKRRKGFNTGKMKILIP